MFSTKLTVFFFFFFFVGFWSWLADKLSFHPLVMKLDFISQVHDKWSLQRGRDSNSQPLGHESSPLPLDHGVLPLNSQFIQIFRKGYNCVFLCNDNNRLYYRITKIQTTTVRLKNPFYSSKVRGFSSLCPHEFVNLPLLWQIWSWMCGAMLKLNQGEDLVFEIS